jgi:hypothetical protein
MALLLMWAFMLAHIAPDSKRIVQQHEGCAVLQENEWWAMLELNQRLPPCEEGTLPLS